MFKRWFWLLLVASFELQGASVWKVSKDQQTVYIGGTLHLLSAEDFPLPDAYATAYNAAKTLVFETDIAGLNTPQFQADSLRLLTYQDNTTLDSVLSPPTYTALQQHLNTRGMDITSMLNFRPSLMSLTLSLTELRRMGFTSQGVDEFYFYRGLMDKKTLDWFESPQQQLTFLAALGGEDEDQMIRYALEDVRQLPTAIKELKHYWLTGNMQGLYETQGLPFRKDFQQIYEQLLVTRNKNWIPVIEAMFDSSDVEFVLVGTMHLAGKDSVLEMLKNKGYQVQQL